MAEASDKPFKPFDAATKELIARRPMDWLRLANLPGASAQPYETDLSTIAADMDKLLLVQHTLPYLAHFEFQAHFIRDSLKRFAWYNLTADYFQEVHFPGQRPLRVETVVILLRREADHPSATGV